MIFEYISRFTKSTNPVIVMPYGGYANDKLLHAEARVLEDEGIEHTEEDSFIKNLYHSYKRFESDEKEGAIVRVSWGNTAREFISDKEGYIYIDEPHNLDLQHTETLWIPVTYELLHNKKVIYSITSSVMKPSVEAEFGVISDLDDTVIHTGVTSLMKWRVIVNSFMKHSHKRMPLEGVHEFYHLLHKGRTGYSQNPFFYLSNSPWNLYDYLCAFLQKFSFPKGTLLLRDVGLEHWRKKKSFMEGNKFVKIKHILETYPDIKFILIGDAADIDADIYTEIARLFPDQILSIYIRTVRKKTRTKRVERIIEKNTDIDVVLIEDSDKAIEHAVLKGYVEQEYSTSNG